jgi:glycerate dehydrogenase
MQTVFLDYKTVDPGDLDLSQLKKITPDIVLYDNTRPSETLERIKDAAVVINNKVRLGKQELENTHKTKLICLTATGTDNIDLETASQRGITVCNIKNYCTNSVVQHVFLSILSLQHHVNAYQQSLMKGLWEESQQFTLLEHPIHELNSKTIGILGLGVLGRGVASMAEAFGMNVLVSESFNSEKQESSCDKQQKPYPRVPFGTMIAQSDIISLHCPLTDETAKLFNKTVFQNMKRNAIIINTARGGLIDDHALLHAIKNQLIAGAALDVLDEEPPGPDHPLMQHKFPNLIITPHIAWAAKEARQRALDRIAENIAAFLNNKPINVVNQN